MFIVDHSEHLTGRLVQTDVGEVDFHIVTSAVAPQDPEKLKKALARVLKSLEVALIVEGVL